MTLCFHCSSSQQALWPIWKCSRPFWSQVYRVGRKRGDALRPQNRGVQWSLRGLHCCFSPCFPMVCSHIVPPEASVPAALSAGRTMLPWRVSSSARVRSSLSVVVSQPWHLAPLQEHELFLWAYAAAKNPAAAKGGSCSLLVGDERRYPKWIRGMKLHWLGTVTEGLNRKAHFIKGVWAVKKIRSHWPKMQHDFHKPFHRSIHKVLLFLLVVVNFFNL